MFFFFQDKKPQQNSVAAFLFVLAGLPVFIGCAQLYGWDIHAPGLMSREFEQDIIAAPVRIALYIPEGQKDIISDDKGTRLSDPQKYYLGEAFVPMLVEAFQRGFEEFILLEAVPDREIMMQYGVEYLAVVKIRDFKNRKQYREQGLDLITETTLFHPDLKLLARFETRGASDAPMVFAKKGGPEVNLNHAIESNLRAVITYTQELIQMRGAAS